MTKQKTNKKTVKQWRQLVLQVVPVVLVAAFIIGSFAKNSNIAVIAVFSAAIIAALALLIATPWIFVAVASLFMFIIIIPSVFLGYCLLALEGIRGRSLDPHMVSDALIFFGLAIPVYYTGWRIAKRSMHHFANKQR